MRNRIIHILLRISFYFILCVFTTFTLLPLVWAISSSFKPLESVMADVANFSLKTLLPLPFSMEGYQGLFEAGFGRSILNTFIVGISVVILGILLNSLAAFSFAKIDFPFKNILFILVLISFMVPFEAIAIPLYLIVKNLGFLNTIYALILPGIANGLTIFLFRQFFSGIPTELLEAALVDGAGLFRVYWEIVIPLSKPALISAGLLLFISQWEAFMWPLISIQDKNLRVIQVAIAYLSVEHITLWNQIFAGVVIAGIIPLVLIFPFQRYYISAITSTGIKG